MKVGTGKRGDKLLLGISNQQASHTRNIILPGKCKTRTLGAGSADVPRRSLS